MDVTFNVNVYSMTKQLEIYGIFDLFIIQIITKRQ